MYYLTFKADNVRLLGFSYLEPVTRNPESQIVFPNIKRSLNDWFGLKLQTQCFQLFG